MNALDRAIAYVSPSWAKDRVAARAQIAAAAPMLRQLESRRGPDPWRINDPASRRWEARQGKPMSRHDRAQIREVFELNPFATKLLGSLLNNAIGFGITGTLKGSKRARAAWKKWERHCDFEGVQDLYGLQELIARTFFVEGEVFIVLRAEKNPSGIPLQLQVLDADMLDTTTVLSGVRIVDGIEYAGGRPVAYHFRQSRELNSYGDTSRVPAEQVIHLFKRNRPGLRRGRSHFEPVLDVLEDVDGYLEAEGIRKKIAACFVGFRAPSEEQDDPAMGAVEPSTDPDEPPVESFYPGMIINGRAGEKMEFGQPAQDQGIMDYMRWGGLRIAAGGQSTYEKTTGDLSNVNYSSYRAGGLEFERFIGRTQWLTLLPQCLHRIGDAWNEAAEPAGVLSRPVEITWTPPPFGSIDRSKDIKADREEMEVGLLSHREAAAARGKDLDELSDEIAADRKMLADKGLTFAGTASDAEKIIGESNDAAA